LIVNNGSDGAVTSLWPTVFAGGVVRGYNVLVFDGPGQQSMLFDRGVPFRYDWEHVITPVVDFLLARPDVDPARIALYGISQAGYWVPRALAFEHRIAAAIADPGVYNAFAPWWNALPAELRELLDAGDKPGFDGAFDEGMRQASPAQRQNWEWRAKPYGLTSAFDVFTAARRYTLAEVAGRITTPLMIADPEGEQFWPGQSQQLSQHLSGVRELVSFTASEGADRHCEPMARSLFEQRMFDWLDRTLDAATTSAISGDRIAASQPGPGGAVAGPSLTDEELVSVLDRYLTILQTHPTAEDMMQRILTPDFRTGFIGGFLWQGLDGLRNFLSQRDGFFDERHDIEGLLDRSGEGDQVQAHTRLWFFLRRWQPPSSVSEEFTGRCYHRWELRRVDGTWRVAAQLVERFTDLDANARRLFATPDEGLNR
jgi:hypothetical protein